MIKILFLKENLNGNYKHISISNPNCIGGGSLYFKNYIHKFIVPVENFPNFTCHIHTQYWKVSEYVQNLNNKYTSNTNMNITRLYNSAFSPTVIYESDQIMQELEKLITIKLRYNTNYLVKDISNEPDYFSQYSKIIPYIDIILLTRY